MKRVAAAFETNLQKAMKGWSQQLVKVEILFSNFFFQFFAVSIFFAELCQISQAFLARYFQFAAVS